jgi:hypothetical protein
MEAQDKNKAEEQNEFGLAEMRKLIDEENCTDSDEELKEVMNGIQLFCKVAYQLYAQQNTSENNNIIQLEEPPLKQVA